MEPNLMLRKITKEKRKIARLKNRLIDFWKRYSRNKAAVAGLLLVLFMILIAFFGPFLAPYDPLSVGSGTAFSPPTSKNLMGTDDLGRDTYSGLLHASRVSLAVGFLAVTTSTLIGVIVGATSGYAGGLIDDILMRITELFQVIPRLFLVLVLVAVFGPSFWSIVFVIGILSWPPTARLIRAEYLSIKEMQFVEAARSLGAKDRDIIFIEILPNAISPVIVNASLQVAAAILLESSLSFLGLGDPNVVSWGLMLKNALPLFRHAWWTALFPGVAISLTTIGFNLCGDGLNDALNPKLYRR